MLQNIRGDQLYQNLIHSQMMVGAFTRVNSTVIQGIMSRNMNSGNSPTKWHSAHEGALSY